MCISDLRFIQFALGSCYAVHIKALSIDIMKVYIERNNIQLLQVELIRFRKKIDFIHVYVSEARIFANQSMFTAYLLDGSNEGSLITIRLVALPP